MLNTKIYNVKLQTLLKVLDASEDNTGFSATYIFQKTMITYSHITAILDGLVTRNFLVKDKVGRTVYYKPTPKYKELLKIVELFNNA
jgi:predicted transcriptional regulator